jgi:hypothetical protein
MFDTAPPSTAGHLQLALNFPRVFVIGCTSFFEYQITNTSSSPLLDLVINFQSSILGIEANDISIGTLRPGDTHSGHLDFSPRLAGSQPIRCHISAVSGRSAIHVCGSCQPCSVYERPTSPTNVSVIVQDIQSNRSTGEKGEFGAVKGDVNISVTDLLPKVQTVNELLQMQLPDAFTSVTLRPFVQRESYEALCIPEDFIHHFEPAEVIHLTPLDGQPHTSASPPSAGWRLCSTETKLTLGRSTQDADLVTRFLPSNEENNALSALISRKHASLQFSPDGKTLIASVLGTQNHLRKGTTRIHPGDALPFLPSSDVLILGQPPAEFQLRCHKRVALLPRRFRILNLSQWIGHRITDDLDTQENWGSVDFEFPNSSPAFWHTLWFHRYISFGRGKGSAIFVDHEEIDPIHGYIHHLRGTFWIECTSRKHGSLMVDGFAMEYGDIIPLRGGRELRIGNLALQVNRIR